MRARFLDQLRTLVILHHAAITYADGAGFWPLTLKSAGPLRSAVLNLLIAVNQAFFMGMFFLISGYLVPASVEKKVAPSFVHDRLRRLGIPLLVTWLVLSPLTEALAATTRGETLTSALLERFLPDQFHLDSGPLWFVIVLMLFSLGYVLWQQLSGYRFVRDPERPLPGIGLLAGLAIATALGSLGLASITPPGQPIGAAAWLSRIGLGYFVTGLGLSYLPACIVLFALGCASAQGQWLERITARQARDWGLIGLLAIAILIALFWPHLSGAESMDTMLKRHGATYLLLSPFIAWGVIAWLLWWFRSHPISFGGLLAEAGVDSYGTYIVQPPISMTSCWWCSTEGSARRNWPPASTNRG